MLSKELGTTHEFGNIVVAGSICLAITFCSDNDDFPTDALPPQPTRALPNPRSSLFGNRLLARERRSSLPAPARVVETFGMGMGRESGWEESEMAAARLASLEESRCVAHSSLTGIVELTPLADLPRSPPLRVLKVPSLRSSSSQYVLLSPRKVLKRFLAASALSQSFEQRTANAQSRSDEVISSKTATTRSWTSVLRSSSDDSVSRSRTRKALTPEDFRGACFSLSIGAISLTPF